jgi:hypothetical protein
MAGGEHHPQKKPENSECRETSLVETQGEDRGPVMIGAEGAGATNARDVGPMNR